MGKGYGEREMSEILGADKAGPADAIKNVSIETFEQDVLAALDDGAGHR